MPSNLRTELEKLDFDFKQGKMLYQDGSDHRGFQEPRQIAKDAPELDVRFQNGANSHEMPRFIATDPWAMFLPYRNGNGSGLMRIERDLRTYLKPDGKLPYPS